MVRWTCLPRHLEHHRPHDRSDQSEVNQLRPRSWRWHQFAATKHQGSLQTRHLVDQKLLRQRDATCSSELDPLAIADANHHPRQKQLDQAEIALRLR